MRRILAELVLIITAVCMAASFAGCLVPTVEYSLETTTYPTYTLPERTGVGVYTRREFDVVKNPYYSMLSETEKNVYSLIYEELLKGNGKFMCPVHANGDELSEAIDAVLNDHPEIFWIENNFGYTYDPTDGSIREISFTFMDFADTPEKLQAAKDKFNSEADKVVSKALSYPSVVERELYLHDYICQNTEYDDAAPYNQSAYSAIVLHRSVCAGYARGFQYLMQRAGVTCYYVPGRTDGLRGDVEGGVNAGGHSWNIVFIDGEFYNVDCLWDDTASDTFGNPIYPFFNLTDEAFIYHARLNKAVNLPECKGTEYKYSNQFGSTIEASDLIFTDAA